MILVNVSGTLAIFFFLNEVGEREMVLKKISGIRFLTEDILSRPYTFQKH